MENKSIFNYISAPAPRFMLRMYLIGRLIEKYFSDDLSICFLEVGAGRGDLAHYLIDKPFSRSATLVDFSHNSVEYLRTRFIFREDIKVIHADLVNSNFKQNYGLIVACEVLEHIEDDISFIRKLYSMCDMQGYLLLSVPSYMRKWQMQDEFSGHIRRYEKEEIESKLRLAGFDILEIMDYGFPLLNIIYPIKQLFYRNNPCDSQSKKTKSSGINRKLFDKIGALWLLPIYYPFMLMQNLFKEGELGDGLLILAIKK